MSYRFVDSFRAGSAVYKPVWHIPLVSVQWITPDDGQRNCPKHVEFHFQNKLEKFVLLVSFVTGKLLGCLRLILRDTAIEFIRNSKIKFDSIQPIDRHDLLVRTSQQDMLSTVSNFYCKWLILNILQEIVIIIVMIIIAKTMIIITIIIITIIMMFYGRI
jgi:hypothetical protein